MKYLFILLSIIIFSCNNQSESPEATTDLSISTIPAKVPDSTERYNILKPYTYLVKCLNRKNGRHLQIGVGSGFFIKKGNDKYFVTNYHVATGFDPKYKGIKDTINEIIVIADTFNLLMPTKRDTMAEKGIISYDYPDLKIINIAPLKLPEEVKINYINEFIHQDVLDEAEYFDTGALKTLFAWGFPFTQPYSFNSILVTAPYIPTKFTVPYFSPEVRQKMRDLYLYNPNMLLVKGMSGSPVFAEFFIKGKRVFSLMGVFSSYYDEYHIVQLVKAKEVIKYLRKT